jgi:hypothetical protein
MRIVRRTANMRKRKLRLEQYERIPCIHFFTRRVSFNMVNFPDEPTAHIDQHEQGPRIHIIKGGKKRRVSRLGYSIAMKGMNTTKDKTHTPYKESNEYKTIICALDYPSTVVARMTILNTSLMLV